MPYISRDQIVAAREMDLLTYTPIFLKIFSLQV